MLRALITMSTDIQYIAVDLPGHGYSPTSICSVPTVSAFAELLNKLCDEICTVQNDPPPYQALTKDLAEKLSGTSSIPTSDGSLPLTSGIEKVIIGHSMGCRIALEVYSQRPRNTSGIVLLDGSWYRSNAKVDEQVEINIDEERMVILQSLGTMFGPISPTEFKQQVTNHLQKIDLVYANQLSRNYVAWDGQRMESALRMVQESKYDGDELPMVLVVQATDGRGARRRCLKKGEETSWMRLVRERVGKTYRGLIVEDSGHWPHIDKPVEVAQAIKDFRDGH